MNNVDEYFDSRLSHDLKRQKVWRVLAKFYFQKLIPTNATVLELGAGYCDFINNIIAAKKIAIDKWSGFAEYADDDVIPIIGNVWNLNEVADNSIDMVFSSNLFEHLTQEQFSTTLNELKPKLKVGARLVILQPNYKKCVNEYFDDYTHISIWTDISIKDFLKSKGYEVKHLVSGFLPLTVKSRFPVWDILVIFYLYSPFKPFAKQMLITAEVS